jgi:selenocysteine lyase/cysteine desulfurase
VNCYAAEAGLKFILDVGTDAIEERVRYLTGRCMDGLEKIGWPSVTPRHAGRRGPMVAIEAKDSAALFAALMERGIATSCRDRNIRATFHFYNSDEDVDTFIAAMAGCRARFR